MMKNEYSVEFYLKSGKRVTNVVEANDIESARQLIENAIESDKKTFVAETTEKVHVTILTEAIEYFEVRPYNLHPQRKTNK